MKLYEKIFHHKISIEKKCPKCSGINFIYNVETLIKNKCQDCDSSLDLFKGKPDIDSIMEFCYHQGYPDVIPESCGDCTHFSRTGIFNVSKGKCNFYNKWTNADFKCVVTEIQKYIDEVHGTMLLCSHCGIEQNKGAVFCTDCGSEITPKVFVKVAHCDKCDDNFPIEKKFCEKDGNKLKIIEIEKGTENQVATIKPKIKQMKTNETVTSDADVELPMKWYKFVTYVICPMGVIAAFYLTIRLSDYVDDIVTFSLLFCSLLIGILMFGLHIKTAWSWKLLLGLYILSSLFGLIETLDEWGPFFYLIFVIIVNAFTTYPNYIYFNKRKHLFVN